jgi:hypothetical protein
VVPNGASPAANTSMSRQHPITRIEQVALDLGRLAEEIEDYAGPNARKTLLYWRSELLAPLDDIKRLTAAEAKSG